MDEQNPIALFLRQRLDEIKRIANDSKQLCKGASDSRNRSLPTFQTCTCRVPDLDTPPRFLRVETFRPIDQQFLSSSDRELLYRSGPFQRGARSRRKRKTRPRGVSRYWNSRGCECSEDPRRFPFVLCHL